MSYHFHQGYFHIISLSANIFRIYLFQLYCFAHEKVILKYVLIYIFFEPIFDTLCISNLVNWNVLICLHGHHCFTLSINGANLISMDMYLWFLFCFHSFLQHVPYLQTIMNLILSQTSRS